jgi:hypothetical protein
MFRAERETDVVWNQMLDRAGCAARVADIPRKRQKFAPSGRPPSYQALNIELRRLMRRVTLRF